MSEGVLFVSFNAQNEVSTIPEVILAEHGCFVGDEPYSNSLALMLNLEVVQFFFSTLELHSPECSLEVAILWIGIEETDASEFTFCVHSFSFPLGLILKP